MNNSSNTDNNLLSHLAFFLSCPFLATEHRKWYVYKAKERQGVLGCPATLKSPGTKEENTLKKKHTKCIRSKEATVCTLTASWKEVQNCHFGVSMKRMMDILREKPQ